MEVKSIKVTCLCGIAEAHNTSDRSQTSAQRNCKRPCVGFGKRIAIADGCAVRKLTNEEHGAIASHDEPAVAIALWELGFCHPLLGWRLRCKEHRIVARQPGWDIA